jgi:hypothetical protein
MHSTAQHSILTGWCQIAGFACMQLQVLLMFTLLTHVYARIPTNLAMLLLLPPFSPPAHAAAYPFWPLPASICGAAIQLPTDSNSDSKAGETAAWQDAAEVSPDSINLLLSQRRHTMAQTHDSLIPALMNLRL